MTSGRTAFETAWGWCGIGWTERGVSALQLPERTRAGALAGLAARLGPGAESRPPPVVRSAMALVARYLAGGSRDLSAVPVDLSRAAPFHRAVLEAARTIGPGRTLTYGELAARAGSRGAARAVGQAMARNPVPLLVPCHRVLAARGRPGGFSAPGGFATKARLLALEGVALEV